MATDMLKTTEMTRRTFTLVMTEGDLPTDEDDRAMLAMDLGDELEEAAAIFRDYLAENYPGVRVEVSR